MFTVRMHNNQELLLPGEKPPVIDKIPATEIDVWEWIAMHVGMQHRGDLEPLPNDRGFLYFTTLGRTFTFYKED